MATFTSLLERDGQLFNATIEYTWHRAYRGARDSILGKRGAGPPLEPDEPEEIEIESVTDENGNSVELTKAEETNLIDQIANSYQPDYDEDPRNE